MAVKNAIIKTKIENEIVELMTKTQVDNVYLTDGTTTLAAKLAEIVTAINDRAKSTDVTAEIKQAIDDLIGGAPATYDTLKEIADYLATHKSEYTALISTMGNKVDKEEGKGLSANDFTDAYKAVLDGLGSLASKSSVTESDLDAALAAKVNAAAEGNHSHTNKAVLDSITSDKLTDWDSKSKVYIQAAQPSALKTGELWVQTLD